MSGPTQQHTRPLVLVAEDNPVLLRIAKAKLSKYDVDVIQANNGKEAVKLFSERKFDLVMMDVQMPVMDGLEAARQMRRLEQQSGKRVPILAVTANQIKSQCMAAGMDDFILKPADYDRVLRHWLPTHARNAS